MAKFLYKSLILAAFICLTVGYSLQSKSLVPTSIHHALETIQQKSPYDFEIIPNYVHEKITLKINSTDRHLKTIKIFDIIGNEIVSVELVHKELYKYDIDFSSFRPGVYLCNLYSDKGIVATRKLLYR
ncbi:MAG TPA: T9SS type A sorting domain-containing protein [Cytophagaceae bacterium]|jgi:hypothetical protein